jgi:hypothetical protein
MVAAGLIDQLGIRSSELRSDGVAVRLSDRGPQVLDVVRTLDANRVTPSSLGIREPTLEDVFRQLTSDGSPAVAAVDGDNPAKRLRA